MYGYNEGGSTGGLQFGLNPQCKMTDFQFNPKGGKDGADAEAIDIEFETLNGVKQIRIFALTPKDKDGNILAPGHKDYKKQFAAFNAKITQIMLCFVSPEELKEAMSRVSSFKTLAEEMVDILPEDYREMEIDVFAQYSWNQKEGQDKKFLEIPSNVKQGKCFVPHVEGEFEEARVTENGTDLVFHFRGEEYEVSKDGKSGTVAIGEKVFSFPANDKGYRALMYLKETEDGFEVHPFTRTDYFLKSAWAKENNDETDEAGSSWE